MIRFFEPKDLEAVRSLHERSSSFPFPRLDLCPIKGVYLHKDEIVGFGGMKATVEAFLVIDRNVSKRIQAQAAQVLLEHGIGDVRKLGGDEIHAFLTGDCSENWGQILISKFGFRDVIGRSMVLEL